MKASFKSSMQDNYTEIINKLHRRHLAKLLDNLREFECPQVILDAYKNQKTFYTNDIKNQVLASIIKENEQTECKQ